MVIRNGESILSNLFLVLSNLLSCLITPIFHSVFQWKKMGTLDPAPLEDGVPWVAANHQPRSISCLLQQRAWLMTGKAM